MDRDEGISKVINVVMSSEAEDFVRSQPVNVQQKITYNIRKLESGVMSKELFKKLTGSNIWELRTMYNGNCYRLFSFWDTDLRTVVVATHGIMKKTQKTPNKEIDKALRLKKEYYERKRIKDI